jgi:hypothetical protein
LPWDWLKDFCTKIDDPETTSKNIPPQYFQKIFPKNKGAPGFKQAHP